MPTKIEWCDETWNPLTGCSPISEGCAHCYARRMAYRLRGRFGYPADDPFRPVFHAENFDKPLFWRKSRKIFVCSMGDLFHKDMPRAWQDEVWRRMIYYDKHTYIILTKRPENILLNNNMIWPFYIWLGVTAENQRCADERVPDLLKVRAGVRFVSVEPCLERVDLRPYLGPDKINWVICGAETGPGARRMEFSWARDLRVQCAQAGVPFFMKKVSKPRDEPERRWAEALLAVREFPEGVTNCKSRCRPGMV